MSLSDKVAQDLIEALANNTPEKVKAVAEARIAALKQTMPLEQQRSEAIAVIDRAQGIMKEADAKTTAQKTDKATLDAAKQLHQGNIDAFEKEKSALTARIKKVLDDEAAIIRKQSENSTYKAQLDAIKATHDARELSLNNRESVIAEQENNLNEAYQKVARKK